MRIFFNRRPVAGPWGGGSKVLAAIAGECERRNHEVTYDLSGYIDIIFCFDPRPDAYSDFNTLLRAKAATNCKLVQRVGDLGTHGKPELLDLVRNTTPYSDLVIFPSAWARDNSRIINRKVAVIPNAPLRDFIIGKQREEFGHPVRLVTHHWSNNAMKGFDLYESLDRFCQKDGRYEFTFIGRKPDRVQLSHHIPPQDVGGLVEILPKHDIYVTASRQEAGANHVLEAMGVGLPVLYHIDGGSINEYCRDRGRCYTDINSLVDILQGEDLQELLKSPRYTYSADDMAKSYVDMLERVRAT